MREVTTLSRLHNQYIVRYYNSWIENYRDENNKEKNNTFYSDEEEDEEEENDYEESFDYNNTNNYFRNTSSMHFDFSSSFSKSNHSI